MDRRAYMLARKIVNELNEINNNTFNECEIEEGIKEYAYMLKNEKHEVLNVLQTEIQNGNKKVLELVKEVLAFCI